MPISIKLKKVLTALQQNKYRVFLCFILLALIQSAFTIRAIVRFPADLSNILIWGLTINRLLVILLVLCVDAFGIFILLFKKGRFIQLLIGNSKAQTLAKRIALLFFLFSLFFNLWPATRLGFLADEYLRIKPLFSLLTFLSGEFILVMHLLSVHPVSAEKTGKPRGQKAPLIFAVLAALAYLALFLYMQEHAVLSSGIITPAIAPVAPLQLFLFWICAVFVYLIRPEAVFKKKSILIAVAASAIYLLGCGVFLSIPLPCSGDMVGEFPPNFVCYPDIYDAPYHVGSLYTTYGEGIFNHWFTDKPLYMLFLSACQWLSGVQIHQYMTLQVVFLSVLPVLVFLLTYRMADFPAALLAAAISISVLANSVWMYSKLGEVNIRIAATEIFTGLLLAFTALSLGKWFHKPDQFFPPILTGLWLGLAALARFNAILVAPFIAFAWAACYLIKKNRCAFRALVSFGTAVLLAVSPWFFINPIIHPFFTNPYLVKIQSILRDRSAVPSGIANQDQNLTRSGTGSHFSHASVIDPSNLAPLPKVEENLVNQTPGLPENVMLHGVNNLLSAFFTFPVNFSFQDLDAVTSQPFWDRDFQPVWKKPLSFENASLWGISVLLFIWGIWKSWQRAGVGGLSALVIFFGYLLGNSLALTSGGRYLVPVFWIVAAYYTVGLMDCSRKIFSRIWGGNIQFEREIESHRQAGTGAETSHSAVGQFFGKSPVQVLGVVLLLLPAAILPFMDSIPDRLPPERSPGVEQKVFDHLEGSLDSSSWGAFLSSRDSVVVEGILFFPQYYSQSRYLPARGSDVFESLILGKDFLYMSLLQNRPPGSITEGSRVLMVGCIDRQGWRWSMLRRIVRAYAVIQLNNEQGIYIDPLAVWTCPQ